RASENSQLNRHSYSARPKRAGMCSRNYVRIAALLVVLGMLASAVYAGGRSLFFPHLISGMGFETRLVFDNPSNASARITLTARGDNGALISGTGVHNPAVVTVPAPQQVIAFSGEVFGLPASSLTLGWVQAESDNSQVTGMLLASAMNQQSAAG